MLESNSLDDYELINKIGEGAYGLVYKAINRKTRRLFAVKQVTIKSETDGVPRSAIREIAILKATNHPNIINLINVFQKNNFLYLVFPLAEMDLKQYLIVNTKERDIESVKRIGLQLFRGLAYLHGKQIMHRDIKPQNILIEGDNSRVRICDFGLSRYYNLPIEQLTPEVTTLWYRSPEVLLGAKDYNSLIDVWSTGCVLVEILKKQPLFIGKDEKDQIRKIIDICGFPDLNQWDNILTLPFYGFIEGLRDFEGREFHLIFKELGEEGVDFFRRVLEVNPKKRLGAKEAMEHKWFDSVRASLSN